MSVRTIVVIVAGAILIVFGPCALWGAETRNLQGHVPTQVRNLTPVGRLPGSQRLDLALGLPLRNREALSNLLKELYGPLSPGYRQFLTPEQFTEQFSPSPEEYQVLVTFAKANEFTITHTHGNRMLLDVNASVADVERAFKITLQVYQHPVEARTFYAPSSEPTVDVSIPILDISGLSNFHLPRPLVHPKAEMPIANGVQPQFGSGPGGTYRGADFRAAYASKVGATGIGQAVGLLEFDGYYAADITSYESQTGLPNVPLNNVLLDNYNGSPGSGNIEVALDIEMAIAMAPGLSQVIVYEAGPNGIPNDILNRMATDNLAKQLSSSWTWSGGPDSTTDQIFQQLASQGQSFFQACGDGDAYTGLVNEPADNPYITIVGGTTLSTTGPAGSWVSEATWNWYNTGSGTNGTGGGVSTSYSIPTWQQGISMSANQGSTTMRNIPDVALTADNIWVAYNNGSSGSVGGTSCAAPLWAAFTALINQQALVNGQSVVGFINPAIYSIGTGAGYGTSFHDIVAGNNTNKASPTKFFAVSGFDLCTGWGTPTGSGLINALGGPPTSQVVSNSLVLTLESCTNNAVDPGEAVTMNFGLVNVGSANTTNLVATLQASGGVLSPGAAQAYGALAAGGAAVSRPFSFTANGSCGGAVTATLQLQDGASSLGTVSFVVRLGAPVPTTVFAENFDGTAAPALPLGWTTAVLSGLAVNWASTNGFSDTSPNSVFAPDATTAGETVLISPGIPITSPSAQLTFRQNYNLAMHTTSRTHYYDGGLLELSIGGGPFTELVAAGGSFVSGGYNCTLTGGTGNPLASSQAWGGNSGGWLTTVAKLPAAAAGQTVQLRWDLGTGLNTSIGVGWFIDSFSVQDSLYQCCAPSADVRANQSVSPAPGIVGQNLTYTLTIANAGPLAASNVTVTDTLPSSVTFVSASPGCVNLGGSVTCAIGTLASGGLSNVVVTVKPIAAGTLTNSVSASSTTADPNLANNVSTNSTSAYVAPSIIAQPTNVVTTAGANASFYVGATGSTPLTYQWTFGGSSISGATITTLGMSNVQASQAGNYAVIVSNPCGSVTSAVATLTVLIPPSITRQPTNQTVVVGSNATFQVSATGTTPLAYQWLLNGSTPVGLSSSNLTVANPQVSQAGSYSVVVTNVAGSVTSSVATLTVLVPPFITLQPSNQTAIVGANVNFQGSANGTTPLSYQWYFKSTALSGATGTTLALNSVQTNEAGNYSFVVTNAAGGATSAVAQLTVLVPPSITGQPTNQTVIAGGNASFQVSASGTSPLNYQWWFNGTNAVGINTNLLTVTNSQPSQAGSYSVVATNSAGSVTSSVAMLTIGIPPSITQQPSSLTVVQGQDATFTVAASGDSPLNYQWRFSGVPVGSGTASNYTITGATAANAGNYDVVVSNAYDSLTSVVAQLTVLVPPSVTSQPTNQTAVAGNSVSFQVAAVGTSPLDYQWWFNGTNAVGTGTNVLIVTNAQTGQAGAYSVVVTNSAGSVTSSVAMLTIGIPPSITQQPASLTVVQGQDATFSVVADGDAPLNYQWRFNSAPVGGSTGSSYTVPGPTIANTGNYDVVVANAYGSATSVVAQLTVLVPPSILTQPTNQTVAAGTSVSFQVSASGTSPLNYQWWFDGTNAVGANTNVITVTNALLAQAGTYSVVVTNSAGSVSSSDAMLVIGIPPSITQQPSSLTVVQRQDATFTVSASGDAPLSYQWRYNGTPVGGTTSSNYTVAATSTTNAGTYDVVITNVFGSVTSTGAQLKVLVPPSILNITASGNAMSVSFGSVTGLSYQLRYKNTLNDAVWVTTSPWVPGTGGVLVLQDTNSVTASRFYRISCQ